MKKGKFYQSRFSKTIVECTEDSIDDTFCGTVLSSPRHEKGYWNSEWSVQSFEEITPDTILDYYTTIKNTHPITDNGTKMEVPGPKSKGDVRFIENHRMKLWSDVVITLIAKEVSFGNEVMANRADKVLAEFDKRFNNR